jgi:hypothetical protein
VFHRSAYRFDDSTRHFIIQFTDLNVQFGDFIVQMGIPIIQFGSFNVRPGIRIVHTNPLWVGTIFFSLTEYTEKHRK